MKSGIQDKILYLRIKRKDREAFIRAYDNYQDDIYRFVFFKVGNKADAEDITSSIFLKAWNHILNNEITDHKTLRSFFYKIARNMVIDHYRKKSSSPQILLDNSEEAASVADTDGGLAKEMEIKTEFQSVYKKIFELKDEYREVIVMKYINELSIAEIARSLNKSKGNVRVTIYRAMKALKELTNDEKDKWQDRDRKIK